MDDQAIVGHKIVREMGPANPKGNFTRRTRISKYQTMVLISKKSFACGSAKVWNAVPNDIRSFKSTHPFKHKMEAYRLGQFNVEISYLQT